MSLRILDIFSVDEYFLKKINSSTLISTCFWILFVISHKLKCRPSKLRLRFDFDGFVENCSIQEMYCSSLSKQCTRTFPSDQNTPMQRHLPGF